MKVGVSSMEIHATNVQWAASGSISVVPIMEDVRSPLG